MTGVQTCALPISFFNCGNVSIDRFIRSSEALDPGYGKTFVWLSYDESEIIGFYNITTGSVDSLNEENTNYKVGGAIHINQFALSEEYQGQEFDKSIKASDFLLAECLDRIYSIRKNVGFSFITLQSTERGFSLYKRNDFEEIEEDMQIVQTEHEIKCTPMYLALDVE